MKVNILTYTKQGVVILGLGILLAAGITFAWGSNSWNEPNDWVADGEIISAQKIGQNFKYLRNAINNVADSVSIFFGPPALQGVHAGGYGGNNSTILCPDGSAVVGIKVSNGRYIDGFELICAELGTSVDAVGTATYEWQTGAWGVCQLNRYSTCGNTTGDSTRTVYCANQYGVQVDGSNCAGSQPDTTKSCTMFMNCR